MVKDHAKTGNLLKCTGLIGGMSWESTLHYYRIINEEIKEKLGGLNSAPILLYSFNFAEIERLQQIGDWPEAGCLLAEKAVLLEKAGADYLIICTNTMHKVADAVEASAGIPLLHIVDPTAKAIREQGFSRVGLLGTSFTMEDDFYKGRLSRKYGLEVVTPAAEDRKIIHRIIFEELCLGRIMEQSRLEFQRIIDDLIKKGAGGVILGCTEISMLIKPQDAEVPLFDTTELHAREAANWAVGF